MSSSCGTGSESAYKQKYKGGAMLLFSLSVCVSGYRHLKTQPVDKYKGTK